MLLLAGVVALATMGAHAGDSLVQMMILFALAKISPTNGFFYPSPFPSRFRDDCVSSEAKRTASPAWMAWPGDRETDAPEITRRSFSSASAVAVMGPALMYPTAPANAVPVASPSIVLPNTRRLAIPQIGYGLYKTPVDQSYRGSMIALCQAGIRYLDTAMAYENSSEVGRAIHDVEGVFPVKYAGLSDKEPPVNRGGRIDRTKIFLATKVDNASQSSDVKAVRTAVLNHLREMNVARVDMLSVHSPLTDKGRRLGTYAAICGLVEEGFVGAAGVCNYGVGALDEILSAGLPPPAVNQLELSPFNQHKDIAAWAADHGTVLSCAAWSKLSGVTGPQDGWGKVAAIANLRNVSKAQVLVRWSLQKGYICVPRAGTSSEKERKSILENSYDGVRDISLNNEEMGILNSLDVKWKAGTLGRRDGWLESDVRGKNWEPTEFL